jgi:RNA polymerase sigma-70 factor (ECF subfamily)
MKTKIEDIWLLYNKDLKRFVLSKVKDKDDCNDIMQDVFLKLHSKINTLRNDEKIKPWLYQITRNTITDYFRNQMVRAGFEAINFPYEKEVQSTNEQFANCVQPHINKLPSIYKEAFIKTEFQNYSQLQLAKELNISYSGAKSRVQRAKELLKSYFKQCCNISTDKYGNILSFQEKHECKLCN